MKPAFNIQRERKEDKICLITSQFSDVDTLGNLVSSDNDVIRNSFVITLCSVFVDRVNQTRFFLFI